MAAVLINIAVCCTFLNDFDKALDRYHEGRAYCQAHDMPLLTAQADFAEGRPVDVVTRLVPVGGNRFDVVNHLEVDEYLSGVLARELLSGWHPETYRAQAIVARDFARIKALAQAARTLRG